MIPRGIRNNNPGNLVQGSLWKGLARLDQQSPAQQQEEHFCVFRLPVWGIRAMARLLNNYYHHHGLTTVEDMLARYAPAHENPTQVYAKTVARALGVEPQDELVLDFDTMTQLVGAIIQFENGANPYTWEIPAGVVMAGLEPLAIPGKERIQYR